ncbi:ankyrin repeat-containing protein [Prunus yedoensis var. nudiflora]|uniref:Ankyrin repeat-containing protein n=1 Tax=Prunus yedoensis var. nudiflora TaxID=2094558 RepID=A0A314UH20_PRUYE|nr:ankyrin repeat-containing protein [Prunus yedoensis var. nudiflora]
MPLTRKIQQTTQRRHDLPHLNQILTPTTNTVLHVYIAYASTPKLVKPKEEAPIKPTSFVEDILQICPTLLCQQNESGETALHMAAKHARRCEDLEQGAAAFALSSSSEEEAAYWKIFIRTPSKEKDTALHEAVRFKHVGVVEILIRKYPDFSYPPNVAGETPLYLAAERRYKALFSEILRTCKHPTYQGPIGRTALHAAVIYGDEEMTKEILEKKKDLAIAADEKGWTPLHYAAFYGRASIVTQLLEADKRSAYMGDEADKKTVLHIAASKGHVNISLKHALKRNGAVSGHRILRENDHDGQKLIKENKGGEDTELDKNIRESHLIVATLVATVTFTAGVTMPGGYYQSDASGGNAMSKVSNQNVMAPAPAPIRPSRVMGMGGKGMISIPDFPCVYLQSGMKK